VSNLLTSRDDAGALADLGERSALVGGQRVGRARRRHARWRSRFGHLVLALVVLAVVSVATAFGIRWLLHSPLFAVSAIEVHGASRVPTRQIISASGLHTGVNFFLVDPREVQRRLEALPEIRHADVIRELPDRVTIMVEERRPFTLVHAAHLHWVDEEGRALGEEPRAVSSPLPLISGLSEEEIASMRTSPVPRARAAIALLRQLVRSGSPLVSEISEIDMSRSEGPVLYTMDGIEVRLGNEDWSDRLGRLEGVLAQVATQESRVRTVDLRFRDQVVFRRGGQP
jgi:cell division protein FtsQ